MGTLPTYTALMRAQSRPAGLRPVVAFASADELIAAQQRAKARLWGKPDNDAPEPRRDIIVRPYNPLKKRDVWDLRTPPPPSDRADDFGTMPHQAHWRVICREVCVKHNIGIADLMSARRDQKTVLARHEAMYRMKHETNLSYPQIGKRMGGRDHSTVIFAVKRHAERMEAMNAQ